MSEQGSYEWLQERIGCIGASEIADISGSKRTIDAALGRTIKELLTGEPTIIKGAPLAWGNEHEHKARAIYYAEYSHVAECGFTTHPIHTRFGCSPDGLVGDHGLIEIKCPFNPYNHLATFVDQKIKPEYYKQMQWQMFVTMRKWCDFISYDPRLPPKSQMVVIRVDRSESEIEKLVEKGVQFLNRLDELMEAAT